MKSTYPAASTFRPGRHLEIFDGPLNDPYQEEGKLAEPAVCGECGAVYLEGRWQWAARPAQAATAHCPACRRIHDEIPAGYVTIEGEFARANRAELLNQIHNTEAHEKSEHPLQRIMEVREEGDKLVVTTTDVHVARAIGEGLHHAYKGELDFQYNRDDYLLRVSWCR